MRRGNAEVYLNIVVPAQAGTHNHRTWCFAKVVQQRLLTQATRRMGPGLRRDDVRNDVVIARSQQFAMTVWKRVRSWLFEN
jgi:hypothetical protein